LFKNLAPTRFERHLMVSASMHIYLPETSARHPLEKTNMSNGLGLG